MVADLGELALAQDAPLLQHQAVGHLLGQIAEVMGHKYQPRALRRGDSQGAAKGSLAGFIEAIKRFVANQQFRIMNQRAEQEDFAEFAVGHLQDAPIGQPAEPEPGEKLFDLPFPPATDGAWSAFPNS